MGGGENQKAFLICLFCIFSKNIFLRIREVITQRHGAAKNKE